MKQFNLLLNIEPLAPFVGSDRIARARVFPPEAAVEACLVEAVPLLIEKHLMEAMTDPVEYAECSQH